jgi:hypothetical protein
VSCPKLEHYSNDLCVSLNTSRDTHKGGQTKKPKDSKKLKGKGNGKEKAITISDEECDVNKTPRR